MQSIPPHLPPPVSNIENHRKWQRIKILLVSVVFGMLAGATGASMMLGWIWPGFGGGNVWFSSKSVNVASRDILDTQTRLELADRMATVYRDLSTIASLNFLSPEKKIGEAMFVSSDGWMILYYPTYNGDYKNWRVLLNNGRSFVVQKVLKDNNSNLVYLKITPEQAGSQFKVVNFADDVKPSDDVYVHNNNNWNHDLVVNKIPRSAQLPHLDSAPNTVIELNKTFNGGDIVVDTQGKIVGIVSDSRYILPSQYVVNVLPGILGTQKVAYRTLGVSGWFSNEQPIIIKNEMTAGFAVAKVILKNSNLKTGDIILEVNGQIADNENLWYTINSNQSLKLKVLRKGKTIEFTQVVLEN